MRDAPGPSNTGLKKVANKENKEQEWLTSLLNPDTHTLPDTSEDKSTYSASAYTANGTTNNDYSTDTRARRCDKKKKKNKESKEQ